MNVFKGLLSLSGALLLLVALSAFVAAKSLHDDLTELANTDGETPFDEDQVGFDNHADIFYYQDDTVNSDYGRKNYMSTKVTLAGQAPDTTGRAVKPAVNPFGVAQRTFKPSQTLMDRWDVKDTGKEAQFFALYHGRGNSFVVNKVRAHLLRTLANAVNDYLPQLDRIGQADKGEESDEEEDSDDESDESDEPSLEDTDPVVKQVIEDIRGTIERVFREVDGTIRKTMADYDDSSATATIAIVSKNYVITAAVGNGKVIGYDNNFSTQNLTPNKDDEGLNNLFGVKKSRKDYIHPHVDFFSRRKNGYQFLLLETASVAANLDDDSASRIVLSAIQQHKQVKSREQEIYSGSLVHILNWLENKLSGFERYFKHSDYSVALVGLNTDYQSIY